MDKPEEHCLKFIISVPKEIMLCHQKHVFHIGQGGFQVFCISMKVRSVKIDVFEDREHIYSANRLPIWLFPKRGHDWEIAQTETCFF